MPNNSVGGVSVSVKLDDKDALQELGKLRRKIEDTQKSLSEKRTKKDSIAAEMEKATSAAADANKKIGELNAALREAATRDQRLGIRQQIAEQGRIFADAKTTINELAPQMDKLNNEISTGEQNLSGMTTRASELEAEVKGSTGAMSKLRTAVGSAAKSMQSSFQRLGRMISRVFVFTVILSGLRALRDYLGDLVLSFPEVRDALAEIKGNLLTAAQPVIEHLIPAFSTLLQVLVQVSAVLADIVSKIFGTTAAQSRESAAALNEQSKAYKKAGSAAQKASRQLASFDQLNVLNDNSSSGGGSADAGGIAPKFDGGFASEMESKIGALELLLGEAFLVLGAILTFSGVNIPLGIALIALGAASIAAAAGLDWDTLKAQMEGPIGKIFTLVAGAALVLGAILAFSGINIPLGIALMVVGAAGLATAAALNWDSIREALEGPLGGVLAIVSAALLVLGAVLTFTGAAVPLGIGLMIAGAAGLAAVAIVNWDSIREALEGPLGKVLAIVSAALLVLGAVLAFSGAAVPLGIGLMIAGAAGLAAVAIVNWDSIRAALQGPIGKITAIVSAALLVLGAVLTFSGAAIPLGIGLMAAGAAGLAAVAIVNWDSVRAALQGPIGIVTALVSGALLVLGIILTFAGIFPLGIALIAAGAAGLVTVAALNWDAIKEKIVDIWGGIKSWWQTTVAPIFTAQWWADKFSSISEGLRQKVTDGINIAIDLFNKFIDWINERLNISWKGLSLFGAEVISAGSYQLVTLPKIPRLAQGAVIPPNREFMAVLGDQRSGTNIETPLATMVEAFKQAMGEGGGGDLHVSLYMDGSKITDAVIKNYNRRARAGGRYSTI